MNCNSNTIGFQDTNITSLDSCSQTCTSLPINLICNQLIIPPSEVILSAQYNKNSNIKIFYLPTSDINGNSWEDKQFYILTEKNGITNKIQILGDNIEITDNYIKLKWIIDDTTTSENGNIQVQLEVFGDNYQYYSQQATFTISDSIDADNQIISNYPSILQQIQEALKTTLTDMKYSRTEGNVIYYTLYYADGSTKDLPFYTSATGIPSGGTEGQVLTKKSDQDYDVEWKSVESDFVKDVQVNGESVVKDAIANIELTEYAKKSELPTKTSELTNDSGFIMNTVNDLENYYLKSETYNQTEINNLLGEKANKTDIPTKVSQLENDEGYLKTIPIASANELGGIKVGKNLSIETDGTLNAEGGSGGTTNYNDLENKPILNSSNTEALETNASETISGTINLHKVSKTGSYNDLNNKPSLDFIPNSEKGAANGVATLGEDTRINKTQLPTDTVYDSGYVHTDNNFTTDLKNKLDGIEDNAQVNKIETVKVNNTALEITDKAINIEVPTKTSDLTNDSGFLTSEINSNLTNGNSTGSLKMISAGTTLGTNSFAEGSNTTTLSANSHAEGKNSNAAGAQSHAEGNFSRTEGDNSHAEGNFAVASGSNSHAEGDNTVADGNNQHVQGKYNISDTTSLDIIGNGTDDDNRSNAYTLDANGNGWFAGEVYVGSTSGTNKDSGSVKLARITDIITDYNNLANRPTLNTNVSTSQPVSESETITGEMVLHKISKTGDYGDLNNKPTIPTKTSDLTNDSDFTTKKYVDDIVGNINTLLSEV